MLTEVFGMPTLRVSMAPALAVLLCSSGVATAAEKPVDRPQPLAAETGASCEALASFDDLMRRFVRDNELPGAALAVARKGRLVYARGFGYADLERKQPVEPDSLFRIASISKPITAVAVMRLVDRGKLKLEDRVFELLPHRPHLADGAELDPRLRKITIRQMLQHTAGFDRGRSGDPMFASVRIAESLGLEPPAAPDAIIRYVMGRKLDFDPGSRYAYSNFGYCLLGRVIEQVTGRGYEEHVTQDVLRPLGIRSMRIGGTLAAGRAKGEVCYYTRGDRTGKAVVGNRPGAEVPRPYGAWYLEAMDAHGGWIASAVDLVRFASAVDAQPSKLLSADSFRAMFARPDGPPGREKDGRPRAFYYGLGWSVRPVAAGGSNRWHAGALDGTSTLLVIRHDGLCWAVLFNGSQTPTGQRPAALIDPLVHGAADAVHAWPQHDLFDSDR